jgi:hypothetical protein
LSISDNRSLLPTRNEDFHHWTFLSDYLFITRIILMNAADTTTCDPRNAGAGLVVHATREHSSPVAHAIRMKRKVCALSVCFSILTALQSDWKWISIGYVCEKSFPPSTLHHLFTGISFISI